MLYICGVIHRDLYSDINSLVKKFPAVAILGPRQIGKTTLAKKIARESKKETIFLDVEKPSDRLILEDAEIFFAENKNKCIVLDEVQFMPELFSVLRPMIDEHRKNSRFILTGSASPDLVQGVSESLAGRIAYTELTTFNTLELPTRISLVKHWFRGGFPDALLAKTDKDVLSWLDNFIKSYVERDLNILFKQSFTATLVRNFWRMLAFNNGGILNASDYARSLGVSAPTVMRYLEFLEGAFLVRRLEPFYANVNKRILRSPKIYIRDSGLLHRLADINNINNLRSNILLGNSWEGFVIEQILQRLPAGILPFYYRTHDGAEIDLVLVKQNKVHIAIEIKYGSNKSPSKGFYNSLQDLKPKKAFVIRYGGRTFTTKNSVVSCSFKSFMEDFLSKI